MVSCVRRIVFFLPSARSPYNLVLLVSHCYGCSLSCGLWAKLLRCVFVAGICYSRGGWSVIAVLKQYEIFCFVHAHISCARAHSVYLCRIVSTCPQSLHFPESSSLILCNRSFVGTISWTIVYHIVLVVVGKNCLFIFFHMFVQLLWGCFSCRFELVIMMLKGCKITRA